MSVPARKVIKLRDPAQIALVPLEQDERYRAGRDNLDRVEKRTAESDRRKKVAAARSRGQAPTRPTEARAQDLIDGGKIVLLPPSAEFQAAEEELLLLNQARIAAHDELERIRSEISHEVCQRFAPVMEESLRAALSALTDLHAALEVGRIVRSRLIGAGYQISAALPDPSFPGAATLAAPGNPEAHSMSPAGRLRDWLEQKGII